MQWDSALPPSNINARWVADLLADLVANIWTANGRLPPRIRPAMTLQTLSGMGDRRLVARLLTLQAEGIITTSTRSPTR